MKEAEIVQTEAQRLPVPFTWLNGTDASVDAVLKGMEEHSWVHLACHGIQAKDPTKSSFLLQDGELELATLMSKSFKHAEIAFLSACQTATGDEKLPEEAVHLAAGMLYAGYSSVFATTWSIYDAAAPVVAKEVYRYLLNELKEGDGIHPGYALHHAVRKLRQQVGENDFLSWVPFVHFGL